MLLSLLPMLLLLLPDLQEAIISHGCTVKSSNITNAVIGLRSHIDAGCTIEVTGCCCLLFVFGARPQGW